MLVKHLQGACLVLSSIGRGEQEPRAVLAQSSQCCCCPVASRVVLAR